YNHTGVDEAWPGGPYTNYVRVLTQQGVRLTGAKVIHRPDLEEDIFERIVVDNVGVYNSFEVDVIVQPSETKELVFYYDLPVELSITKEQRNYNLVWQKQAGATGDSYEFNLAPPFGMVVEKGTHNIELNEGVISSVGTLDNDVKVSLVLQ
ncbi:hypothetical protein ACFL13_03045, partial [Patescibacteria group bacterium]